MRRGRLPAANVPAAIEANLARKTRASVLAADEREILLADFMRSASMSPHGGSRGRVPRDMRQLTESSASDLRGR